MGDMAGRSFSGDTGIGTFSTRGGRLSSELLFNDERGVLDIGADGVERHAEVLMLDLRLLENQPRFACESSSSLQLFGLPRNRAPKPSSTTS
jgi:hypothetical protein